jgi:hypothetical protein
MPAPRHRRVRAHNPWDSPGRVDLRLEVPAWTDRALCAEIGVEPYFNNYERAKASCLGCPVLNECLEWALGFDEWMDQYGIFGGTSPSERKRLRREREQVAA